VQRFYEAFGQKGLEIYAVSVDRTREEWIRAIRERDLNWINVSELREWNSESVNIYNVQATPMFYLLGRSKEIIGKYSSTTPLFSRLSVLLTG
jgi:hypothetical protein